MSDQAERLRQLVVGAASSAPAAESSRPTAARRLVFTSGKGGVGTSNLVLNLALALGQTGHRVLVVDADAGRAALDLLGGIAPRRDLGDVLGGRCALAEAVLPLDRAQPPRVHLLAGAHALRTQPDQLESAPERLAAEMADLARGFDFVLIDAGSGLLGGAGTLAAEAHELVVVTTPEPAAMADAHAAIARARGAQAAELRLVVCHAASTSEARDTLERLTASSRQFLGQVVRPLGAVCADRAVPRAVRRRRPFLLESPRGPAARGVRRLARTLAAERHLAPARTPGSHPAAPRARLALALLANRLGWPTPGPGPVVPIASTALRGH